MQQNTIKISTVLYIAGLPKHGTVKSTPSMAIAIQIGTVQWGIGQYNTLQCNTVQYNTAQHNTAQQNRVHYHTIQNSIRQSFVWFDRPGESSPEKDCCWCCYLLWRLIGRREFGLSVCQVNNNTS